MGVLANVFEAAGLATVGISLIRGQAEDSRAPRFLHCQFPLGRPLGRPGDAAFQTDVLRRALALVARNDVPVLEDHPVVIGDEAADALACTLPPRADDGLHPAVAEARGLRAAYERNRAATGRTLVGRLGDADLVADLVGRFARYLDGETLAEVDLDSRCAAAGHDVRAYYEEAALALVEHVPGARQAESWFFRSTEAGRLLRAVREKLRDADAHRAEWFGLVPVTQV